MLLCRFSASLRPSRGLHPGKRWSNLVRKTSIRWQQMLLNSKTQFWSFQFLPPSFSLLCRSRVWTASCGLLWTWKWTCRCLGRDRPGWTKSCTCCGSWRPSWRRRGSRARESCRRGSEKTNASGSSSSRRRNRWVDFCLSAAAGGAERRTGSHLKLSNADSRGAAAGEAGGKDAEGSSEGRPQDPGPEPQRGPRSPDLQVRQQSQSWNKRSFSVVTAMQTSCFLLLMCFQREDGLLHTSKDQHPQPAGWRRVEKHFKVFPPQSDPAFPSANEVHNWWSDEEF